MDKILNDLANMWNKSKILFFILLPLVILAIGFNLYRDYQVMKAKEDLKDTENKDSKLEKEKREALAKAGKEKAKADAAAKKRKDRKEEDVDEDWHKG